MIIFYEGFSFKNGNFENVDFYCINMSLYNVYKYIYECMYMYIYENI